MSSCEIIAFKKGKEIERKEFANGHGGAPFIWTALAGKYLGDPMAWLWKGDDLFKLDEDSRVPVQEKAILLMTADLATISKKNFLLAISDLVSFADTFGNPQKICHLTGWAGFIEECKGDCIGFFLNTICDDPWEGYNFKARKSPRHFEVYEELKRLKK